MRYFAQKVSVQDHTLNDINLESICYNGCVLNNMLDPSLYTFQGL